MRLPVSIKIAAAAFCAAAALSCSSVGDPYLKTLRMDMEQLAAIDSINVDRYDLFQARNVVKADNGWLALSTTKGDYRLLFLDPATSEHFFAIRNGRGPGEIIQGSSFHGSGDAAMYYDVNNAVCIRIDLCRTVENKEIAADTVGVFKGASKPVYLARCGDGFVSGNLLDGEAWYSYYDRQGNVVSSVDALDFKEITEGGDFRISFLTSSKYAAAPSGTRVCVASVGSPSLSFAEVKSGLLNEYARYAIPPSGMVKGRMTAESRSAFCGLDADEDYVYAIYSGHSIADDVLPTDECRHLIVYSWDGSPVRHYRLDHNVNSVHVAGNSLYATTTYPESCVYRFELPEDLFHAGR